MDDLQNQNTAPYKKDFAEYGDLFGRYARDFFSPYFEDEAEVISDSVKVRDTHIGYAISADIPKINSHLFNLSVEDNSLIIEAQDSKSNYYQKITFADPVDEQFESQFSEGNLKVILTKAERH